MGLEGESSDVFKRLPFFDFIGVKEMPQNFVKLSFIKASAIKKFRTLLNNAKRTGLALPESKNEKST